MGKICRLIKLPDDILADVLGRLNIRDIPSLRLSCKRLNTATRSRDLWATFALKRLVAQGLPWPEYALPLTNLPTETIEALSVRAAMMKERWDSRTEYSWTGNRVSTMLAVSRKHSAGPVTYLSFIRSRWLVVRTKSGYIHIWDILNPEVLGPTMSWGVMTGSPDSGVIRDLGNNGVFLIISTHLGYTYRLHLDPPYIAEPRLRFGWSVRPVTLFGYHGALDVREDMIAFSRSDLDHSAHIVSDISSGVVRLLSGMRIATKNMAIQIRSHLVVVANSYQIDIYSAADAFGAIHESLVTGFAGTVVPLQSVNYLNHRMVQDVGLVQPGACSEVLGISAEDGSADSHIIMNVSIGTGIYRWRLRSADSLKDNEIPWFHWVTEPDMTTMIHADFITKLCWGNSGVRLAYVGGSDTAKPILMGGARLPKPTRAPFLRTWEDQKYCELGENDFAFSWTCAFDDCAGLVATATTTGRIWLVGATKNSVSTFWPDLLVDPNSSAFSLMTPQQSSATLPSSSTHCPTRISGEVDSSKGGNTARDTSPGPDPAVASKVTIKGAASRDIGVIHEMRGDELKHYEAFKQREQDGDRPDATEDLCGRLGESPSRNSPESGSCIACAPTSCPPPLAWLEWSPIEALPHSSVSVDSLSDHLALSQVAINEADIPPGWKNDWSAYDYFPNWAGHYGSMQWLFNDVLHIYGKARPVLYRDVQETDEEEDPDDQAEWDPPDGPDVIVEVNGDFFLHEHGALRTRLIMGGMEEILESLRGERPLILGAPLGVDGNAITVQMTWAQYGERTRQSTPSSRTVDVPPYILSQVVPADLEGTNISNTSASVPIDLDNHSHPVASPTHSSIESLS